VWKLSFSQTNKETPLKTSNSLHYARPVGNHLLAEQLEMLLLHADEKYFYGSAAVDKIQLR